MARRQISHFDLFRQMEMEMQRFTEDALRSVLFHPHVDMYETAEALVIKMELAGIKPDRLSVTLSADDKTLTVAGTRAETAQEQRERIRCYQLEIYFGTFEREIALPADLPFDRDNITANYRDGFLVISLPRRDPVVAEKRNIEITGE